MKKTNKKTILLFISIILVLISILGVNALIIGGREEGYFKGTIDELRIYNRALSEEEAIQHYYSYLNKYDIDKWSLYTNQSNLAEGTYTYYGCAKDGAGNNNCTETRVVIICMDTDDDEICDKDEPEGCVGENAMNIPDDTDCTDYNGFDYETGCWRKTLKVAGIPCNTDEWYYNYSCSSDKANIIKRHYNWTCNGIGSCNILSIGNIETVIECSTTKNCSGPDYSFNPDSYKCVCKKDTDGDGLCDGDDKCPTENETNFNELGHTNTSCIEWINFNPTTGCHVNVTYAGKIIGEWCPEGTCDEPVQINWTCNEVGEKILKDKSCEQMKQKCKGNPDFNLSTCALNFSRSEEDVLCQEHEEKCWSPDKPYYNKFGDGEGGCCGDDLDECWIDGKNNSCCYSENLTKVVYLINPDESIGYCVLLGEKKTNYSAGNCENGKTYCWDPNSEQCCGDDPDETWEYSTSYYIRDVLVNETCYKGAWSVVKKKKATYFDLISRLLEIFG